MDIGSVYLDATVDTFRSQKSLADRAIAQLADPLLHTPLDENTNSIAVIMKHVGGNLRSRWLEFLTTDGEKPDRNRDDEFIDSFNGRDEVLAHWNNGWDVLFTTLSSLTPDDLKATITIRSEPHSVPQAIQRSLGHTSYHVGQIVQLARYLAKDEWETLSIAKGQSQAFNQAHRSKFEK